VNLPKGSTFDVRERAEGKQQRILGERRWEMSQRKIVWEVHWTLKGIWDSGGGGEAAFNVRQTDKKISETISRQQKE
jgi:hypothetical protein